MRRFLPNALLIAGFATVAWRVYYSIQPIRLTQSTAEGTYSDTYYVVAHLHLIAGLLLAIALPVLLHVVFLRRATRIWVRRASYICLFTSLVGLLIWSFSDWLIGHGSPRRYVDYAEIHLRMVLLGFISLGLVATACCASVILSIGEWLHRRRHR